MQIWISHPRPPPQPKDFSPNLNAGCFEHLKFSLPLHAHWESKREQVKQEGETANGEKTIIGWWLRRVAVQLQLGFTEVKDEEITIKESATYIPSEWSPIQAYA